MSGSSNAYIDLFPLLHSGERQRYPVRGIGGIKPFTFHPLALADRLPSEPNMAAILIELVHRL